MRIYYILWVPLTTGMWAVLGWGNTPYLCTFTLWDACVQSCRSSCSNACVCQERVTVVGAGRGTNASSEYSQPINMMQKNKKQSKGKRYSVYQGKGAIRVCSRGRESGWCCVRECMSLKGGSGSSRRESREWEFIEGIHQGHNCTWCLFWLSPLSNDCKGHFRCFVEDCKPMRGKVQWGVVRERKTLAPDLQTIATSSRFRGFCSSQSEAGGTLRNQVSQRIAIDQATFPLTVIGHEGERGCTWEDIIL